MVVTSSRKEAVRYKLGFDKFIVAQGYQNIHAMVAFSGEVEFSDKDPNVEDLLGEKFTESNMNPNLKGRDMRKAFDSESSGRGMPPNVLAQGPADSDRAAPE